MAINYNDTGFNYSKRDFISGIKDLNLPSQGKSLEPSAVFRALHEFL